MNRVLPLNRLSLQAPRPARPCAAGWALLLAALPLALLAGCRSGGETGAIQRAAALPSGDARVAVAPGDGPRATFAVARRELGDVQVDTGAEARFPVRNDGKAPLHILSAEGECGCLSPHFPPVIDPGKSGEIQVRFEPQPLWSGKVEKGVRVKTDDPTQPEARLVLAGTVIPYIRIEPASPLVINVQRGQAYTRDLRLMARPGHSITISNPKSDSPLVKPTLEPPLPSDRDHAYRLHLQMGPYNQPGDITTRVSLATTDPKVSQLPVIVVALAQSGPVVSPREVFVSSLAPGDQGKELTHLQVFARSGGLKLLGVDTGNPGLKAEIQPKSPGQFYEVVLRYAGGWKSGPVSSTIKVRTDDRTDPVLTIPFSASVQ